jgi:hypothetical protein
MWGITPVHYVPNGSMNFVYFYGAFHVRSFQVQVNMLVFPRIVFNNDGVAVPGSVVALQISVQTFNYNRFFRFELISYFTVN